MCGNWKLSEHHVRIYCCGQSEPIKWKISIANQCWFSSLKHYLIFLWSPQGGSILTQRARQHLYPGLSWYMYCTLLDLSWYIYWTLPGFSWYMYLARINAEAVLCFPSQICFQSKFPSQICQFYHLSQAALNEDALLFKQRQRQSFTNMSNIPI